jgi:mono/diheme cytochrome c family protein
MKGRRHLAWASALALSAALVLLAATVKLDGKVHANWQQFLGRFHPLAVHLPIGLIVLVPVLEIAGAVRPPLREAAAFLLPLAFAACLGSLLLGYLLAYGGGEAGALVTRHLWGGTVLTIGVLWCWVVRTSAGSGSHARSYPLLLTSVLLALVWTAHQGGSLTHGSGYLTEYLPAPLRRIASFGAVRAASSDSFYAQHVHPIFDANCVSCHGASKVQGGLRLDSYDRLMRGGSDGAVIVPGVAARSILLERITLPPSSKHFMPAEGRPPLKPEQISWIRAWIEQGASPTATTLAGISLPQPSKEPPIQPVADYSALLPAMRQAEQAQGAKLMAVSAKASDGLILNATDTAAKFGDAQLAAFLSFAPYIVEAELGHTAITDAGLDTLVKFTHLRALHLEGTAITGGGLAKLTSLTQLTYLNLSETRVTANAIAPLRSMKNLRHLYLFNTPAEPATADAATPTARSTQ